MWQYISVTPVLRGEKGRPLGLPVSQWETLSQNMTEEDTTQH